MLCKRFPRLSPSVITLLTFIVPVSFAAVQDRISVPVSGNSRVAIPNSVHGKVRAATDLGATPVDTKLENMTVRFSLSAAQQTALAQLLSDQQNPTSSRYHQWLTPAQYGAQFGLSNADVAKVTSWLTGQGFTVQEVPASNTYVRFSGTVAQVNAAFATSIHNLQLNGNLHFANVTNISMPDALTGVVSGVTGLHDFKLKPRVHTQKVKFTSSISGNHYIAPADFYQIYNETPTLQAGFSGSTVTIAVMGQVDISQADVSAFRTAAGLAASTVTMKLYGADPGTGANCTSSNVNCPTPNLDDVQESSLDVEWAGATAPGANVVFVTSTDVMTSITDMVNDASLSSTVGIASISYGDCESSWGTSDLNTYNLLFAQANSEGITVVGPGGDDGATDCDYSDTSATSGLEVDFPASSPYVTGMGGSMFNEGSATGGTTYWAASDNTLNAGSFVTNATYSVAGYLPEEVWNEDIAGLTFSAGGGGVSKFFSKPAWQLGTGVPNDASRDVPDLALNAAASHDGYLYCAAGSCTNGSFRASDGQTLTVGGGTSFATPSFAGILALIDQKTGTRMGNVNPVIYALANTTSLYNNTTSSVFHDITTGNNDSLCTAGTPNCTNGVSIGYSAGTGYDMATGWGSINVYNLVNAWNTVTPLGTGGTGKTVSNTVVSAQPTSVTAGTSVTFTAVVAGTSGTPTGTVQFLVNNNEVGAAVPLSSGTATYSYATTCSSLGQLIVSASYSGDATYAGSKGSGITAGGTANSTPVEVSVTSGSCPDFSITTSNSTVGVTSGNPSATITVASINNFAGTVTFTAAATESTSTVPTVVFSPTSVTLAAGGNASATLTLSNVTAQLRRPAIGGRSGKRDAPWYAGSGVAVAGLLFFVTPRRRRLGTFLVAMLAFGAISGLSGCGGQTNGVISAGTSGSYVVTITGTYSGGSGTISHSTTIDFNVR